MIPSLSELSQPLRRADRESVTPLTAPDEDKAVMLGSGQMAVVGFVILALLAMVATISYLAGRIADPETGSNPMAATAATTGEQRLMVVEPPNAPIPPPKATAIPAKTAPRVETTASAEGKAETTVTFGEGQERLYYQVAAVDRGMAEVSVEFLMKKGLNATMTPGPDPATFRVLVGPLANEAEASQTKAQLEAAGFRPFPKKLRLGS